MPLHAQVLYVLDSVDQRRGRSLINQSLRITLPIPFRHTRDLRFMLTHEILQHDNEVLDTFVVVLMKPFSFLQGAQLRGRCAVRSNHNLLFLDFVILLQQLVLLFLLNFKLLYTLGQSLYRFFQVLVLSILFLAIPLRSMSNLLTTGILIASLSASGSTALPRRIASGLKLHGLVHGALLEHALVDVTETCHGRVPLHANLVGRGSCGTTITRTGVGPVENIISFLIVQHLQILPQLSL
mmetsp:Transcript_12597/g.45991  ORF Transcript_12597/g.45991 Transcript_12597/m.45991 type:complete len:239 (-) Transcript_12597:457-1173(-)